MIEFGVKLSFGNEEFLPLFVNFVFRAVSQIQFFIQILLLNILIFLLFSINCKYLFFLYSVVHANIFGPLHCHGMLSVMMVYLRTLLGLVFGGEFFGLTVV